MNSNPMNGKEIAVGPDSNKTNTLILYNALIFQIALIIIFPLYFHNNLPRGKTTTLNSVTSEIKCSNGPHPVTKSGPECHIYSVKSSLLSLQSWLPTPVGCV
jgi:hypothetical protein